VAIVADGIPKAVELARSWTRTRPPAIWIAKRAARAVVEPAREDHRKRAGAGKSRGSNGRIAP
jgi:hypothetical protein